MMNETEKKAISRTANSLHELASSLDLCAETTRTELVQTLHKHGDFLTSLLAGSAENAETVDPEKKVGRLVGIMSNKTHILAWNYSDGLDIRVTGDEMSSKVWQVRVECAGELRMMGSVFGGRWRTERLVRALRNCHLCGKYPALDHDAACSERREEVHVPALLAKRIRRVRERHAEAAAGI